MCSMPVAPRVAVGLHVTLTAPFRPLSGSFQPVRDGAFLPLETTLMALVRASVQARDAGDRDRSQLRAFSTAFGRAPDFIDGHQHVHLFPQIREALLSVVKDAAPHAWVRQCGRIVPPLRRFADRKALLLDWLSRGFRRLANEYGVRTNPAFAGTYDFEPDADYAKLFPAFLDGLAGRQRRHVPSGLRRRRAGAARSADHAARARIQLPAAMTAFPTCSRPMASRWPEAQSGHKKIRLRHLAKGHSAAAGASLHEGGHEGEPPMTPQERQLVTELFDRLATLETAPRDTDAERAIADGLGRAPHAVYALVQTALVQDEALKRANARIRELEGAPDAAPAQGGFLDTMRAAISGNRPGARSSVPTVQPADTRWGTPPGVQNQTAQPAQSVSAGLPIAAARSWAPRHRRRRASSAARCCSTASARCSAMVAIGGGSFGAVDRAYAGDAQSPWGSTAGSAADSDLARQAGLDDIGRTAGGDSADGSSRGFGLFGNSNPDTDVDQNFDQDDGGGFDSGGLDSGGGDTV